MVKRTPKAAIKDIPTAGLLPISTVTSQLMEDVQCIYGGKYASVDAVQSYPQNIVLEANLAGPKNGELVVIATRSKQLREELLLRLAYRTAIANKKNVAVYSANEFFVQFARKLVGAMSGIPPDVNIHDGNLNEAEFGRLVSELTKLNAAKIFMYPIQTIHFGWLRVTAHKLIKSTCDIGLVLVDGVQCLLDDQRHCISTAQGLSGLKGLAEELSVTAIALYQLNPSVKDHPSTLTREELAEIEKLSASTDGFVLMSGTPEELVFMPPKIPNAKPIAWLEQITNNITGRRSYAYAD